MELNPSRGRPKKDPEQRRSEHVHIRVRPSHKAIVEQEAERRDASMSLLVVRIGFEEMNPSGRLIPDPRSWRWLFEKASHYREVANSALNNSPRRELKSSEFRRKKKKLKQRLEKRKALWRSARDEARRETLGVRLKPRRHDWLEERADKKNTSPSGLLRARAFEGIDRRDQMQKVAADLHTFEERIDAIRGENTIGLPDEEEVRREMLNLASDIERSLEELREET